MSKHREPAPDHRRILRVLAWTACLLLLSACGRDVPQAPPEAAPETVPVSVTATPQPEEPSEPPQPEEIAEAIAQADLGDYHVAIVSAEDFTTAEGKPGIRFYYDFTNLSPAPASAFFSLTASASQNGSSLLGAFTLEEVPEYSYASLEIMPGLTIRCVAEYTFAPENGAVEFHLEDPEERVLSASFDPEQLPGRPSPDYEIAPVPDPDWTEGLPDHGDLGEGLHVTILRGEVSQDWSGASMLRIYYELDNQSQRAVSFFANVKSTVMQDGVALESTFTNGDVPEDAGELVDVEPGETLTVAKCYLLRSQSPVTVVLSDLYADGTVGTVIPVAS